MSKEITMPENVPTGNNNYKDVEYPETGTYLARCYGIAFLGKVTKYYKDDEKTQPEIAILWELPTEMREFIEGRGEQPVATHKIYNHSSDERSNLYKHINIWSEGQVTQENVVGFNVAKLLGKYCLLSVEKDVQQKGDRTFQKLDINALSPVPKGQKIETEGVNEPFVFKIDEFDKEDFFRLPPLVRYECSKSAEFKEQGLDYDELKNSGKEEEKQEPKSEEGQAWV